MIKWLVCLMGLSVFVPSVSARVPYVDVFDKSNVDIFRVDNGKGQKGFCESNRDTLKKGKKVISVELGSAHPVFGRELGRHVEGVSSNYRKYISREMKGVHLGVSFKYYFPSNFGIGVTYNHFNFNDELLNQQYILSDGSLLSGDFRNRIREDYIGLSGYYHINTKKENWSLDMGAGLGYLRYKDKQVVIYSYDVLGESFGATSEIALNYKMNENISLSLGFLWVTGILRSYDIIDGDGSETVSLDKEKYKDITHSNITLKVSYYFTK